MKNLSSYNQDLSIPRKKDLDALETKVDGKQDAITGGASTITTSNLTANRVLISNNSGKVEASYFVSEELGYLTGIESPVQLQIDDLKTAREFYFYPSGNLNDETLALDEDSRDELILYMNKLDVEYIPENPGAPNSFARPCLVCNISSGGVVILRLINVDGDSTVYYFGGYYTDSGGTTYHALVKITDIGIEAVVNEQAVSSVNNKTGAVTLTAADLNVVPTTRTINNKALSSNITLTASDVGAQPKITVNGIVQGDGAGNLSAVETTSADLLDLNPAAVGLGNVDNVKQYSATNPPPYPVKSVNGLTGAVIVPVLPDVSADDNGKILTVVDGTWVLVDSLYQTSYVGTGTYGSANPNTLSFDFVPKLVMITVLSGSNAQVPAFFTQGYAWSYFMNVSGNSTGTTATASAIVVTWSEDGKTLSWYGKGTTAAGQLNANGYTYRVTAWR